MSNIKNPTLRRRTKELTECAEDARECRLLAYELIDIGRLIEGMVSHMRDLQRKVDGQAEHIKMLNEKLTDDSEQHTELIEQLKWERDVAIQQLKDLGYGFGEKPRTADSPQTDISKSTLRTDCTGCRFVGSYDTEFPCANCVRKNKDYYDTPQTERSE